MPCVRVLVVDDHPTVLMGLRALIDGEPDFELVDAVGSAHAALAVAKREPVDVAVVDYQLGERNGLWLSHKLKRLSHPPGVLIHSAYSDGMLVAAAVVAEADAVLSKSELASELCEAIRAVARGSRPLPPLPARVAELVRVTLDPEEQAIFGMLHAAIPVAEVAATVGASPAVIESRRATMLRRLETIDVRGWSAGARVRHTAHDG
ncbi:MAG: response regulator [Solirubrobacteraceae bacterium]